MRSLPLLLPLRIRGVSFSTWAGAFTLFILGGVAGIDFITGLLLWIGPTDSPLGRFAADFIVWCFYADPRTGNMNWVFPIAFFAESLLMAGLIYWVGQESLRLIWKRSFLWKVFPLLLALVVGAGGLYGLTKYSPSLSNESGKVPVFPATALRVALPVPHFTLLDQINNPVTDSVFFGKVTVLTSFYAHCFNACPAILSQLRRVAENIPKSDRNRFQILGVTMDPEKDRPADLTEAMKIHGLDTLPCLLATGEPLSTNLFLDKMGFARKRDSVTGVIEHTSLIFVIGSNGQIAYRFSVGEIQEQWLLSAVKLLLQEKQQPSQI